MSTDETGFGRCLVVDGVSYPAAMKFKWENFAPRRIGYEFNEAGQALYVTPGGGRATAAQIEAGAR